MTALRQEVLQMISDADQILTKEEVLPEEPESAFESGEYGDKLDQRLVALPMV